MKGHRPAGVPRASAARRKATHLSSVRVGGGGGRCVVPGAAVGGAGVAEAGAGEEVADGFGTAERRRWRWWRRGGIGGRGESQSVWAGATVDGAALWPGVAVAVPADRTCVVGLVVVQTVLWMTCVNICGLSSGMDVHCVSGANLLFFSTQFFFPFAFFPPCVSLLLLFSAGGTGRRPKSLFSPHPKVPSRISPRLLFSVR